MKKKFILLTATLLFFISSISEVSAQCTENFDAVTAPALPAGWSAVTLMDCDGSDPWVTSITTPNSVPNSAFVTAPGCTSDEVLVSNYILITSTAAQLTFQRKHYLETNWDGLVLEISIDGGSFIDILEAGGSFTAGGYNAVLNGTGTNPIRGRQAWTGFTSNAFVTTTVNLPASANGKIIALRWRRGTDISVAGTGVYIDNITITGCTTPVFVCTENFDGVTVPSLPFGWTAATALDCATSNPWATVNSLSNSAPNSVFVNDPDCVSDEYLYSRVFQIVSTSAQITFKRSNDLETNFDGVVLEVSIGGTPFTDILLAGGTFVAGNYNGTISNCCNSPLSGRSAWTGNSGGWITTTINLPASANNKSIVLRWRRGTDFSVSGTGAYIDGISITGAVCFTPCATNIILTPNQGSLCNNTQIVLTASVVGAVYDWYRNDIKIEGVTGNSYTATSGGIYYVRSTIGGCLVTSNVAVLEPGSIAPSLGTSGVYCLGSPVSIGMPVSQSDQEYIWKKNGVIVNGPVTGNGGALSYNFNMDAGRVGEYVVETSKSGCIGAVSDTVYLRLPVITGLATVKVCTNEATIKWNRVIPAFISQAYEYELSQSITPPSSGTLISDSFKIVTVNPSTVYYFHVRSYCDVSGLGNWATISFTTPANSLTLSPTSGSFCTSPSPITITASGGGATYTWFKDGFFINGQTGSSYNATSGGTYYATSTIGGCLFTSNEVILESATIVPNLGGTGIYCFGDAVNVGIPLTEVEQNYTWLRNGSPVYGPIGGNGGNQSLQFNMELSRVGTYVVKSTKPGCVEVFSDPVYVGFAQINNLMTTDICASGVTFKWNRVAPVNISQSYDYEVTQSSTPTGNGTITSDSIKTVTALNSSTLYYIHVRAACNFGFSFGEWTTISFTTPASSISLSPTSETVCNNTKLLTATGNAVSYVWYRNDNIIDGATGSTYNVSQAGTYRVEAIISGCTNVSNNAGVTETTIVAPIVDLGTNSVTSQVYCTNALAEVRLTNSQPSQQYTWYRNGTSIGGNGGNQSLALAVSPSTAGEYDITTSKSGCGDAISNNVYVIEAKVTGLQTTAICSNQVSFEWNSVASGENYQYVVIQSSTPPANPVNPVTTSAISATFSSLLPATTYYIHIRAASGPDYTSFCSTWTTTSFTTGSSTDPFVWSGDINTSWFNTGNWSCGQVPGSTSEVIINGGKPNYPLVTSNVTIKKLTVNAGATVNVQPGVTLTITSQ